MMTHLATRHLAVLTLVTLALAAAPRADADPSVLFADPGGHSGSETLLTFEYPDLINGDDIPLTDGVEFILTSGGPAKFYSFTYPREFGPQDPGTLINYWGSGKPYPDLEIRFPAPIHRLSFELRASDADDVALTLLSSGSVVDEVTLPSRGEDQLYFYGFENPAGFDEVLLDIQANFSGAFLLDNLSFESLGAEPPADDPPIFSCAGFDSPIEALLEDPKQGKYAHFFELWLHKSPVKLLRARLLDEEDLELGGEDLIAPPLAQVLFTPEDGEETLDVTADVTWKDAFTFNPKGYWRLSLKRYRMQMPGTYVVTMESGDESEYVIDPTCSKSIVEKARRHGHLRHKDRKHKGRGHHSWH